MTLSFTDSVVVPVADVSDATATAGALESYSFDHVTVVHVVEKGEGVPDKTPVEQSESVAEDAFDAFRESFPDADAATVYRRDVVQGIVDVADDVDASAIVFRPREGGRIVRFLSGDISLRLLTEADRPVIAVPEGRDE